MELCSVFHLMVEEIIQADDFAVADGQIGGRGLRGGSVPEAYARGEQKNEDDERVSHGGSVLVDYFAGCSGVSGMENRNSVTWR